MSESINKIKVKDITYDVEDSVARAGLDKVLLFESITWAELKSLKDNGNLAPGTKYRITDYITTTAQKNTISTGNQFDIIVEALTENTLSELASACLHEGDTYFSSQGCNLEAWQLWYDIENDTEKYEWADTENGKGVIYRMIDEKNNDCPYDFKNILFYTTSNTINTTSDNYYYTFSYVISGVLYDGTIEKRVTGCRNNSMGVCIASGKSILNGNIFTNSSFGYNCLYNKFGDNCYYNTFGDNCYYNTFGYGCDNNTFVFNCDNNSFGNNCQNNKFGYGCDNNTFGNNCQNNKFGYNCQNNKFGYNCYNNTFGNNCANNTFGYNCANNTFGYNCANNTFGYNCANNTFGDNCYYNSFGNNCYSNSFGDNCNSNNFGNKFELKVVNHNKTSITLNEEFYDDGSGSLVPIKHPDLSTQPSILPYKFMGQYVYEQLIPTSELLIDVANDYVYLPDSLINGNFVLDCCVIGTYGVAPIYLKKHPKGWTLYHERLGGDGFKNFDYIKVVYSSMLEEGDYYGYNNY